MPSSSFMLPPAFPSSRLRRDAALMIGYGLLFFLAHGVASQWSGSYFYSLFYPAAGLRFALLWYAGPRFLPHILLAELMMQWLSGSIQPHYPGIFNDLANIMRPPVFYGIVIALVRWIEKRNRADIATPPMPFALATVLTPTFATLAQLAWMIVQPGGQSLPSSEPFATTAISFFVGDMLGIVLIAPPLLLLLRARSRSEEGDDRLERDLRLRHGGEAGIVFACGWAFAFALMQVDPGLMLMPIILTTSWIGLRCGRITAWFTIVAIAIATLTISQGIEDIPTRMALHVTLAAVAVSGYLAGSYAEAQARAQQAIARRDRMLYQAERLKTLRAMSVAVIHEISQPLSTLSIESRHLARLAKEETASREEIGEIAGLLERKVNALSDMVRRLRRFGGRTVDEPSPLALAALIEDMAAIIRPEARNARILLRIGPVGKDLAVLGQEIELVQALVNLVRNAIAASPGSSITITVDRIDNQGRVTIANVPSPDARPYPGMGVGTLVARAIVEAHGGGITREDHDDGFIFHHLSLPLAETRHG